MTSGTALLLALALGGGWATDGRTDQAAVARLRAGARRGDAARVAEGAKGLPPEILDVVAQEAACGGQPVVLRAVVGLGARPKVFGRGALRCMLRARAAPGIGPYSGRLPRPLAFDDAPLAEVAGLLVKQGVDLRAPFDDGGSILVDAVSTCHPALVRAVLAGDVDVDAKAHGVAPLALAARCSGEEMDLLVARGAKGVEAAAGGALDALVDFERDPARFAAHLADLLPRGARPRIADGSALRRAAARGNPVAVTALLAAGADPNAEHDGDAPLHVLAKSCGGDCEGAARELVKAGAKLDATGLEGLTPYELASADGRAPLVGHLLATLPWKPLGRLGATASASGVLVEKQRAADRYVPGRALDGAPATCWCVRGAGVPAADEIEDPDEEAPDAPAWLEVRLARPAVVAALRIYPGCGDAPGVYRANHRLAVVKVTLDGEPEERWLPDAMRYHDLGLRSAGPVEVLRLDLRAVHRGARYDDTCIAEIQAVLE